MILSLKVYHLKLVGTPCKLHFWQNIDFWHSVPYCTKKQKLLSPVFYFTCAFTAIISLTWSYIGLRFYNTSLLLLLSKQCVKNIIWEGKEEKKKKNQIFDLYKQKFFRCLDGELQSKTFAVLESLSGEKQVGWMHHHQNCCFKQNENSSFILFCKNYFFKGIPNSSSNIAVISQ